MNRGVRNLLLYGALAATLAAAWWASRLPHDEDTADGAARHTSAASNPGTPSNAEPAKDTSPVRLALAKVDAFAARDWTPPPPPPPKPLPPPPPPPPMAPPLPYRYLGKLQEAGQLVVFLNSGGRPIPVKGGEILDGQWRVEEITARMVRFTYIPLAQTATLTIGEAL